MLIKKNTKNRTVMQELYPQRDKIKLLITEHIGNHYADALLERVLEYDCTITKHQIYNLFKHGYKNKSELILSAAVELIEEKAGYKVL